MVCPYSDNKKLNIPTSLFNSDYYEVIIQYYSSVINIGKLSLGFYAILSPNIELSKRSSSLFLF
jgi:hypothetical protein